MKLREVATSPTNFITALGVGAFQGQDFTTYTQYWSVLRGNFDMEHIDVILGHHVEHRDSMSRLPILVVECSKGGHLERVEIRNKEYFTTQSISYSKKLNYPEIPFIRIPIFPIPLYTYFF